MLDGSEPSMLTMMDGWEVWGLNWIVAAYLGAIIAANLITTAWGPGASIITAFAAIGLDLTSRDKLHEAWHRNGLVWKMGCLIATGSIISWLLNRDAGSIAIASCVAFAAAAIVDTIAYAALGNYSKLLRINGSNLLSALVDSVLFPAIAWGFPLMWPIVIGQYVAKVSGGAVWSMLLRKQW